MKHDITYVDEGYGRESASCTCGKTWPWMESATLVHNAQFHKHTAELEDEIGRLTTERDVRQQYGDRMKDERDEARAEVERLRRGAAHLTDDYLEEITETRMCVDRLERERNEARAEVERLREALHEAYRHGFKMGREYETDTTEPLPDLTLYEKTEEECCAALAGKGTP